ncbi:MAG: SpoIIE family protein phosphatase, partial [Planctomycetota bacterium]|nr:SpoIIE family protein phosphatase [Planctomycetota bacterium]
TAVVFGFFVVRLFERNLRNDVIQYGYGQTVAFREICREVHQDYIVWVTNHGEEKPFFHLTRVGQEHAARLKRVLAAEPRINAAVVYVSRAPVRDPSDAVVWTGEERPLVYTRPAGVERVDLAGADPSIVYWFGTYNGEPALFFRAPLAGSGDSLNAVVQAVFSSKDIQAETNSLVWKVVAVGAALSVLGLLISLLLARAVTLPIHALVGDLDAIAKGDLDHEPVVQSRDEIGLLARAMARMTRALREKRDQDRHLERINADLSLAQEVVANLLPKKRVSLPGYDIDLAYRCAREIGGDYYDFIPIDNEHLALVVADVSGKGIAASMILATTRTLLRMMAPLNLSPADVLSKVNYHLHRDVKRGMFVTAVYGLLNVRTRQFRVASAGHNAMLVWRGRKKTIEALRPQGMALGFDRGPGFDRYVREMEIQLEPGDRVVLYTDGVVEAMNARKEEWGMETFEKFAVAYADRPSAEFVNDLLMELDRHKGDAEQHDDITVVTMRIL